ncbi:hypothetical protein Pelo_19947 [Pelomyxa schiedti]|nr:hypothetical protein Pelo_19947 [Pelomyxa schiedti]
MRQPKARGVLRHEHAGRGRLGRRKGTAAEHDVPAAVVPDVGDHRLPEEEVEPQDAVVTQRDQAGVDLPPGGPPGLQPLPVDVDDADGVPPRSEDDPVVVGHQIVICLRPRPRLTSAALSCPRCGPCPP